MSVLDFGGGGGGGSNTAQLNRIEQKIDSIIGSNQLLFSQLTLVPTFQTGTNNSWRIAPSNLANVTDGIPTTSTNLFEVNGSPYAYGEIVIFPGIVIPQYSRIDFRAGLQSLNGDRASFELAAFLNGNYTNIWAFLGTTSNSQDVIVDVSVILASAWTSLRFRQWDIGVTAPRSRIYDLKVFSVS